MVDFTINVIVNTSRAERGVRQVEQGLTRTDRAANQLATTIRRVFTVAAITATARAVVNLADRYTNLQNRLRLVTTDSRNLSDVQTVLTQVSRDTRVGLEATVDLYARAARATSELGLTQLETVEFVESLNQAVALSGVSAQSAQAGLFQLSQGLAAGALRGEELNSVLEQIPEVARFLAEGLDIPIGQLRELGASGQLTAEQVIRAFQDQAMAINAAFAETAPTVSQAFQLIGDNTLLLVGNFLQGTGITDAFANALFFLGENIDLVAISVGALALVFGGPLLVNGILAAASAFRALTASILSNPFFLAGAVAITSAIVLFQDELRMLAGEVREVVQEFTGLGNAADEARARLAEAQQQTRRQTQSQDNAADSARNETAAVNSLNGALAANAAAAGGAAAAQDRFASSADRAAAAGGGAGQVLTRGNSPEEQLRQDFLAEGFGSPVGLSQGQSVSAVRDQLNRRIRARNERAAAINELRRNLGRTEDSLLGRNSQFGNDTPGFQNGGSFVVGGRSGVDRNLLSVNGVAAARVSRGEEVQVTRRGGGGGNVIMNIQTPDAGSFQRTQRQIQSTAFTQLSRASGRNN